MGSSAQGSLHAVGVEVVRLFNRIQALGAQILAEGGRSGTEAWPQNSFEAEADRFELWAVNLGLFVAGHGSLDYRLRHAESLRNTLKTFLESLQSALIEGASIYQLRLMSS